MLRTVRVPRAWSTLAGFTLASLLVVAGISYSDSKRLVAADTPADSVRLTPISATLRSGEGESPEALIDRATHSAFLSAEDSEVVIALGASREVTSLKLYGPAPYQLTVKANRSGAWETIEGLERLDLRNLSDNWHRFEASLPVSTNKLLLVLNAKKSNKSDGIKELEIWGKAPSLASKSARDLLDAVQGANPPAHVRLATASPVEARLGGVGGEATAVFNATIDAAPTAIRRAWLVYESQGAGHWVSTRRSVNGGSMLGGVHRFGASAWTTQLEPVDPSLLTQGNNTITFSALDGEVDYAIRGMQLLLELDNGTNFVEQLSAYPSTDINNAYTLNDGDANTGWTPYPSGGEVADDPSISLLFDKPTVLERVALSLRNQLDGKIEVAFFREGEWHQSTVGPFLGKKLSAGENQLEISSADAVEGVQLRFVNGEGSSAEITEIQPVGSGVGYTWGPAIRLTYPEGGEYYGNEAHVRAFVQPLDNGSGPAAVTVAGLPVATEDGSFEATVSKEQAGYGADAEDAPWQFLIEAVYPDGQRLTRTVYLNQYGDISQTQSMRRSASSLKSAQLNSDPYTLENDEGILALGDGAMDEPASTLTISSLTAKDLPPLDPGMTNVTRGPRKGYRFGPHGKKFKKNIKVKLPFDKKKLPPGMTVADIRTYYFDEESGHWRALERVKVDEQKNEVVSHTNHFTDMINATLVLPEHPQAAGFNPTQIKDIKAADPGAGINLIEPPEANNLGDARLSYPIEIPPGRNGMQPQLAIQYSSGGGNGWMGLGWDLSVPSISVDTRWGVPRYSAQKETETYLLNGQMLTPHSRHLSMEQLPLRAPGDKRFYARVEGQFNKIIRHGNTPSDYWWEVTDKSGTTHIYGNDGTAGESQATLGGGQGIYRWMLKKSIDAHGNAVIYDYVVETDKGLPQGTVDGYQIYPSQIRYTDYLGEGTQTGKYTVHFQLESGRPDVIIDGRGGFKQVTAKRLKQIDVRYDSQPVRSYVLDYQTGPYIKTLLHSVSQKGKPVANGKQQVLATHTFDYFDEVTESEGVYQGFGSGDPWNVGSGGIDIQFLTQDVSTSALGGSEGTGVGGSFSIGGEPIADKKSLSANATVGGSFNTSTGVNALIDVNGDGLPDKVYKSGNTFKYHRNTYRPYTTDNIVFETPGDSSLTGLSEISFEESQSFNFGGQAYAGGANFIGDTGITYSQQNTYLADVNGDGLIDVVDNGSVKFGRVTDLSNGKVEFLGLSSGTGYPIGAGALDTTGILDEETLNNLEKEILENNPLADAVRRWVAPYSGTIRISGDVHLVDVTTDENVDSETQEKRKTSKSADGVRVSVEQQGVDVNPLWTVRITEEDYNSKSLSKIYDEEGKVIADSVSPLNAITVTKGEVFYFRVQSIRDGNFDIVEWSPSITYLDKPQAAIDVNSLTSYQYNAADDFVYAGRISLVPIVFKGTIRFDGILRKTAVTTDDVTLSIYQLSKSEYESQIVDRRDLTMLHLNHTPVIRDTLAWDETGAINLSDYPGIEVNVDDKLFVMVEIDSPIDLTRLKWEAGSIPGGRIYPDIGPVKVYYTEAYNSDETPSAIDDEGNTVGEDGLPTDDNGYPSGWVAGEKMEVTDKDGNYLIQIDVSQEMNFYPHSSLDKAQDAWSVPEMGMLLIQPVVTPKPKLMGIDGNGDKVFSQVFHYDTEVVFTAKKQGELIGKRAMQLAEDTAFNPYAYSYAIPATKGEQYYFDFSTRDPALDSISGLPPTIESTAVKVHFIRPESIKDLKKVAVNSASNAVILGNSGNTATILPLLSLKASDEPVQGTVILHVDKTVLDEDGVSVTSTLVDRKIALDSETPFSPYEHAFDVLMNGVERLTFRYVVEDDALAKRLNEHTVRVIYSRNHSREANEFSDLTLFETDPAIAETLAQEKTYPGMASRPVSRNGKIAVAPVIRHNGNEIIGIDGEFTLSVWRKFVLLDTAGEPVVDENGVTQYGVEKLRDYPIQLHQGEKVNSGLNTFDVVAKAGDEIIYRYHTEDPALLEQGLELALWTQFRHFGGGAVPPGWNPAQALHSYGYWGVFPNGYRGWSDVGYNGQGEFADLPIQSDRLELSSDDGDYKFDKKDAKDKADSQSMKDQTVFPVWPHAGKQRWLSGDDNLWFESGRISASRMTQDDVDFVDSADLNRQVDGGIERGAGAAAVPRLSIVDRQNTVGAGYLINISSTTTPSESMMDFLDLNGDRFPDVVGGGTIQFTEMNGALGGMRGSYLYGTDAATLGVDKVRKSVSVANTISAGGTVAKAIANARALFNPAGGIAENNSENANFGIKGSLGSRTNDIDEEFRDINGDGLPDRVIREGTTLWVALNIGYGFLPAEKWESLGGVLDNSESVSYNLGVSYNDGAKQYAGSVAVTVTGGITHKTLDDVNGDGLPDIVEQGAGSLVVRLNLGNGFAAPQDAISLQAEGGNLQLGLNESFSLNGGASATTHIGPLCLVGCFIPVNPGANFSESVARPESQLKDVNGDGYPDYVYSTSPESMSVAENKRGRTNLLKSITRPLGATITLDYTRTGNTYEQPQNVWALSRVSVDDGLDDDGGSLLTTFRYDGGFHDRGEREFYGFRSVVTEQRDSSTNDIYRSISRLFHNDSFYTKGLLESEVLEAGAANDAAFEPYRKTENRYRFGTMPGNVEITDGNLAAALESETLSIAPLLESTTKSFYEGSEAVSKSTTSSFTYDAYGNVTRFSDNGDSDDNDATDDVSATIRYSVEKDSCLERYIVGNATIIEVFDAGSNLKRHREGTIDCVDGYSANNGKVSILKQYLKQGNTTHQLGYDKYGNLESVIGQKADTGTAGDQQISVTIAYEETVNTFPKTVTDHFGLSSSNTYDYAFGKQLSNTDTNGNTISYTYDAFGRTETVTGPYQQGGEQYTIEFDYHPHPTAGPAYAITHHYDRFRSPGGQDTIDTVLFTDGLKRVVQTQKDAGLYSAGNGVEDGVIISGRVMFDGLGRQIEQFYHGSELSGDSAGAQRTSATFIADFNRVEGEANSVAEYDVMDRQTKVTLADGSSTTMSYALAEQPTSSGGIGGGLRFLTTVIDDKGNRRESYRDVRELISTVREYVKDEENNLQPIDTHYVYDALKQITDVYDAKNHRTAVAYDKLGRRTSIDNPDTGKVEYAYNLNGDLRFKLTPNLRKAGAKLDNGAIEYVYDHDRLVNIRYPNAPANDAQGGTPPDPIDVTYTYGENTPENAEAGRVGRIIRVDHQSGYEERWYGKLGEVVQERKWVQIPGDLWNSGQKHNQGTTQPEEYEVFTTQYEYDTFGRLQNMVFPDGEKLTYRYNAGGLPQSVHGTYKRNPYPYVTLIGYDEYEQRVRVEMGNGAETDYSYDPKLRRLATLQTESNGYQFQNLQYVYDTVGNVTDLTNQVDPPSSGMGGHVRQHFDYDELNRLVSANGSFQGDPDTTEKYSLSMSYDAIHNITRKNQRHWVEGLDSNGTKHGTTYDWSYRYTGAQPHAPTRIGELDAASGDIVGRTFSYDANGNQEGWTNDKNANRRSIEWDDENRIQSVDDKGQYSQYSYDDAGQRVIKQSRQNLTVYVNQFFTERNGSIGSKHIFVGNSRMLTKVTGGTQFIRSYDGVTDAKLPPGQAKQSEKTNNGKANGKTQEKSNNGKHLGQQKNADKANNGKGKGNTKTTPSKSNNSDGTKRYGVNGIEHRSDRANEVAQNTCKNKHLREQYCDENGNVVIDTGTGSTETSGTVGDTTTGETFMEEVVQLGSQGEQLFYYHSDHLGSTGYVTRENGELHEQIQYFPFGETWVQQGGNTEKDPYLFTAKELDEETGLYYYGARYYDPRTSVWASADPVLGKYLAGRPNGGVFRSINVNLYRYAELNPVRLIDPTGMSDEDFSQYWKQALKLENSGHYDTSGVEAALSDMSTKPEFRENLDSIKEKHGSAVLRVDGGEVSQVEIGTKNVSILIGLYSEQEYRVGSGHLESALTEAAAAGDDKKWDMIADEMVRIDNDYITEKFSLRRTLYHEVAHAADAPSSVGGFLTHMGHADDNQRVIPETNRFMFKYYGEPFRADHSGPATDRYLLK